MSCSVGHVQFLHESRQGLEEIITSFRIHGLDQLWLGQLWFWSRGESHQGMTASRRFLLWADRLVQLWFGSRGEIRQGVTALRNTILRCGLDQSMKVIRG